MGSSQNILPSLSCIGFPDAGFRKTPSGHHFSHGDQLACGGAVFGEARLHAAMVSVCIESRGWRLSSVGRALQEELGAPALWGAEINLPGRC